MENRGKTSKRRMGTVPAVAGSGAAKTSPAPLPIDPHYEYCRPYIYGKLICPNGHGQLVLAKLLLCGVHVWMCQECDTIKPCKYEGGSRQHNKTNRGNL